MAWMKAAGVPCRFDSLSTTSGGDNLSDRFAERSLRMIFSETDINKSEGDADLALETAPEIPSSQLRRRKAGMSYLSTPDAAMASACEFLQRALELTELRTNSDAVPPHPAASICGT
jgi:hypothetical protein